MLLGYPGWTSVELAVCDSFIIGCPVLVLVLVISMDSQSSDEADLLVEQGHRYKDVSLGVSGSYDDLIGLMKIRFICSSPHNYILFIELSPQLEKKIYLS